jgi:hypothetical protein
MGKMLLEEDERLLPLPPLVSPPLALRSVVDADAPVLGLELAAALVATACASVALVGTVWAVTVKAVLG